MKNNLFATRALAEECVKNNFEGCELSETSADIDNFDDDESLRYLGSRRGECSAYEVEDADGKALAIVAWWEEGGEYRIRLNGKTVQTVTYWSLAMHIMKELAEEEEDKEIDNENYVAADVNCVIDSKEVVNVKEL